MAGWKGQRGPGVGMDQGASEIKSGGSGGGSSWKGHGDEGPKSSPTAPVPGRINIPAGTGEKKGA